MYGRIDDYSGLNKGGIGLGLTICKTLHSKLCPNGGQIEVDSEYGLGSIFWFRIPYNVLEKP